MTLLDQSLALTEQRRQVGLATGLDTARIATLRDQRRAEIPLLEAERQGALFRLATLTGRTPRELPAQAAARSRTLRLDQPIPVGDGAELLARRPDVRAAERRLAAATARIGVASADLYPRITLGGSVGSSGSGIGNIFGANPLTWLIGPLISWTANRSAARARVAGARADTQAALATFDGAVLEALEETETALSTYQQSLNRRDSLRAARDQAETAAGSPALASARATSAHSSLSTPNEPRPKPKLRSRRPTPLSPTPRSTSFAPSAADGRARHGIGANPSAASAPASEAPDRNFPMVGVPPLPGPVRQFSAG